MVNRATLGRSIGTDVASGRCKDAPSWPTTSPSPDMKPIEKPFTPARRAIRFNTGLSRRVLVSGSGIPPLMIVSVLPASLHSPSAP